MIHLYFFVSMIFINTDITESYQHVNKIKKPEAKSTIDTENLVSIDGQVDDHENYWDAISNLQEDIEVEETMQLNAHGGHHGKQLTPEEIKAKELVVF